MSPAEQIAALQAENAQLRAELARWKPAKKPAPRKRQRLQVAS